MFQMAESVTIHRSPQDVFAFVANLNNFPKWRANLASSTVTSSNATDVGARCDEEIQMGPMRIPASCEITTFSNGREFTFRAVSPGLIYDGHLLIEPSNGDSRLTLSGEVRPEGFLRLMQPMLKLRMSEGVRQEVANIKAAMEAM